MKNQTIPIRVHKDFKNLLDGTKLDRIKIGNSNPLKPPTDARTTLAIARLIKKYPKLKQELITSDFK